MQQRIVYLDLLRCVAAIAVVAVHTLGGYRDLLGEIPIHHWLGAITMNSGLRWAVPVFIMISGAVLLSDPRPFHWRYYLRRRVAKVVIPFLMWSCLFACLASYSVHDGWNADLLKDKVSNFIFQETYYHLGFFYYFIPLYFVAPLLMYAVKQGDRAPLIALLVVWLITTGLNLFFIDGLWSNDLWLFSGYLLLGYGLSKYDNPSTLVLWGMAAIAIAIMVYSAFQVVTLSLEVNEYRVGRWLSYKTINTVVEATALFILFRYLASKLSENAKKVVAFVSRHSLGIYLAHPLMLLPLYQWRWYEGNHSLWVIPVWTAIGFLGGLLMSWAFSQSRFTRWLMP